MKQFNVASKMDNIKPGLNSLNLSNRHTVQELMFLIFNIAYSRQIVSQFSSHWPLLSIHQVSVDVEINFLLGEGLAKV